jgi:hypothetical protein
LHIKDGIPAGRGVIVSGRRPNQHVPVVFEENGVKFFVTVELGLGQAHSIGFPDARRRRARQHD